MLKSISRLTIINAIYGLLAVRKLTGCTTRIFFFQLTSHLPGLMLDLLGLETLHRNPILMIETEEDTAQTVW